MALSKVIDDERGRATYHAIRSVMLRFMDDPRFVVVVASWADDTTRRKEPPLYVRWFTTPHNGEVTRADLYAFLKTLPEFDGAGDI